MNMKNCAGISQTPGMSMTIEMIDGMYGGCHIEPRDTPGCWGRPGGREVGPRQHECISGVENSRQRQA